jgi:hypothetical protein
MTRASRMAKGIAAHLAFLHGSQSRRLPASLLMLLQIHRHLGGKALSFNIRETLKTEREEKLTAEDEVRLAESVVAPRLPKARPPVLIEKREPDLVRVERIERLDFEKTA